MHPDHPTSASPSTPPPPPPSTPPSAPPPPLPAPPRTFFLHLSRPLLTRLLTPFAPLLSSPSFSFSSLSTSPDDPAPIFALYTFLDTLHSAPTPALAPDPALSPLAPLFDLLSSVARAASPAGRESLIKHDLTRRLPARLGSEDLAATAYLDFPDLFSSVRVASTSDAIKGFVLYEASPGCEPRFDASALEATASYLGQWFDSKHRSAVCDIFPRRRDGEIQFEIAHGKTPQTLELIEESLATRVVTQTSKQRSYAVYYESTRVLAVHAMEFIKEGIRKSFGHGCGEGADYFTPAKSLLDMRPLRDLDAALAPDPEVGVTKVVLREIDVEESGSGGSYWPGKFPDVRVSPQGPRVRAALAAEEGHATHLKLAIDMVGIKRTQIVEIYALRNQLVYDRRNPGVERILLAWLRKRGVWIAEERAPGEAAGDANGAGARAETYDTTDETAQGAGASA